MLTSEARRALHWTIRLELFLDQGRSLEAFFVVLKYSFAITLALPNNDEVGMQIFKDMAWWVPEQTFAAMFAIVATVQLIGVMLSYYNIPGYWVPRSVGAMLGILLWLWVVIKNILAGLTYTALFPTAMTCTLASIWVLWRAYNNLPLPTVSVTAPRWQKSTDHDRSSH